MKAKALFLLLFMACYCCSDHHGDKKIDISQIDSVVYGLPDCSNVDSITVSHINRTKFIHLYPDTYEKMKHKFPQDSNSSENVQVDEFKINHHGNTNKIRYYSIENEFLIIERFVMLDSIVDALVPSVYDSVDIIEYYYLSSDCCVKEQYSRGCANRAQMSIKEGSCKIRVSEMNSLLK